MTGKTMTYQGPIEADVDLTTPDAKAVLAGETPSDGAQPQESTSNQATPAGEVDAKTNSGVPRARLNQVIEQRNAAQSENEALRAQIEEFTRQQTTAMQSAGGVDLDAMLTKLDELSDAKEIAVQEGDLDAAKALGRELNRMSVAVARAQASQAVVGENYVAQEQSLFTQTANTLMEQFPMLHPQSQNYSQPLVDNIRALSAVKLHENPNMTEAQSLLEATTQTMSLFGMVGVGGNKRPVNASIARNLAAAAAQPAFIGTTGAGDTSGLEPDLAGIDLEKLSDEQWDKLPVSVKNKLLGK
jgi:hypothetical protein